MRLKRRLISFALLALFGATFLADLVPSKHPEHTSLHVVMEHGVQSPEADISTLGYGFSSNDEASDCGDPCHMGTCHFGHCAHASSANAQESSPNLPPARHGISDVAAPLSPYLADVRRPPRQIHA